MWKRLGSTFLRGSTCSRSKALLGSYPVMGQLAGWVKIGKTKLGRKQVAVGGEGDISADYQESGFGLARDLTAPQGYD